MTNSDLWTPFLEIRRDLIEAWRREGVSCTEIARNLSMDPGQVWLISRVESGSAPADAAAAIDLERLIPSERQPKKRTR